MKTISILRNAGIFMVLLMLMNCISASGQNIMSPEEWFKAGLGKIPQQTPVEKRYKMTADYINYDLNGKFLNKFRASGIVTCGLEDGNVRWNNCNVASSFTENGEFPEGNKMNYMEGFTYKPGDNMVADDAFPDFPPDSYYAKNLVWDMLGFDAFGLAFLDSLQLNKSFSAKNLEGALPLAGEGSFVNRNTTARWNGISEINGKLCAVIEFRQLNGSVEVKNPGMEMKGRSHYWGNIWVSLLYRTIEYGDLYESVTMKLKLAGQDREQWFDTCRIVTLTRIDSK